MTSENGGIIGKFALIFTCMIVGIVLIILGLNLENLWISGFGGGLFTLSIFGVLIAIKNM